MTEAWQQIAVWGMIAIAAVVAVYSGINAWRAIRRGECGSCPACGGQTQSDLPLDPKKKERIVFLPADDLRLGARSKRS